MKQLEIEWRHLEKDGRTCDRCGDTGLELRSAVSALKHSLNEAGWEIVFKETFLTEEQIPDSNMILLNGIPIEEILPQAKKSESCCVSCKDLLGTSILCRAIEREGIIYETIPSAMIREAVKRYIDHHQS